MQINRQISEYKQNIPLNSLTNILDTQVIQEWNDTELDHHQDLCIHQMFEMQVERSPQSIAVIFENTQLTYWQLNQQANQLAHHLRALGVGPEVLVGICLERSLEMIVGLLGILKAGGAYVPLDPAYPSERLAFILEDTQTPVLLTQEKLLKNLPPHQAQVVCLDSNWQGNIQNSQENPVNETTDDNLIYVIYTSGSTGQPKGVMIPHRGIRNQLYWRQTTFRLTQADKVLLTISFSFDPSVWQIFWPLCFGGQLIVARPGGHQDTAYLVKVITEQKITVLALVPSILRVLLEEKGIENCSFLRHITCGGEALPGELIERFFAKLDLDNVLHNCYGPTEASIDTTFWTCQRGTNSTIAPIGRPVANAEIHILDENLQPVPVGESGELHIGGIGLARGYLNRPELTIDKFIFNPFSSEPGARLYKTGDLARYLSDGNIEFTGRIDYQVKIRGYRIELGEIEAILDQHPSLTQTLVIAREDINGDKQLVAYVVANAEQIPSRVELRRFLQSQLPEYMVPAYFVFLDTLPLNPNGKIDRQALPAPDLSRQASEVTFVAPRNEVEREITQIWEQILGVQPIGVKDNFFEVGGNSILAVKLFWQIEKIFSKNLPLAILFQSGTVEALAKIISQEEDLAINLASVNTLDKSKSSWSSLVEIQPNGSKPPFFCIHGLGGEVLCFRELVLHLGLDQPFYGLQPQGLDGKQPLYTRVEDMATHYIQEIQTIQPNGPYFLGGYSFGGVVAFEMARQLQQQGQEVGILVMLDSCRPGYSWRAPFLKRVFLHLNNIAQQGPVYFWQRLVKWIYWGTQRLQKTYQRYLQGIIDFPANDKHLKIMDANTQAISEYIFSPYLGRAVLLRADDQSRDEAIGTQYDPQFGWGDLVAGGLDIHYISGSHHNLFNEPHVQVLAETLRNCLIQAQSPNN
ncbi:amino acid adenylation domain-containing protein [Nostoc sp. FACHB-133]|uniref:non-ribosomal peptide synthetase n=1 Tax=Nostoc sp. FACHB-133 TaxID=2692835 RepID=UPI0028C458F7|nr:amino acid adenylation domain-containing protein [Nostoc sp. FACHB-133]